MCSAIDIGNINPSGEYRLYMYTGKPNATYDNYGYDGLISRRYMYAIIDASMDRGSLSFGLLYQQILFLALKKQLTNKCVVSIIKPYIKSIINF